MSLVLYMLTSVYSNFAGKYGVIGKLENKCAALIQLALIQLVQAKTWTPKIFINTPNCGLNLGVIYLRLKLMQLESWFIKINLTYIE